MPQRFAGYSRGGPSASKRQTEVLGRAYGESGRPNRQRRSLPCLLRRADSCHLHRVAWQVLGREGRVLGAQPTLTSGPRSASTKVLPHWRRSMRQNHMKLNGFFNIRNWAT